MRRINWDDVAVAAADTNVDDSAVPASSRRSRVDSADTLAAAVNKNARGSSSSVADRGAVYPPRSVFRPTPRNLTVSPGEKATLKCRVENLGTKTVSRHNS